MKREFSIISRRRFASSIIIGAGALWGPGSFAEQFIQTPRQTEGPFYPDHLPVDTSNGLLVIHDAITPTYVVDIFVNGAAH